MVALAFELVDGLWQVTIDADDRIRIDLLNLTDEGFLDAFKRLLEEQRAASALAALSVLRSVKQSGNA